MDYAGYKVSVAYGIISTQGYKRRMVFSMTDLYGFWQQLSRGPAVLFLGQAYLGSESAADPLLLELQKRYGGSSTSPKYNQLWESVEGQSSEAALTWMSELCRRLPSPQWLQSVANFPWNSVFSSAIDPIWLTTFRNEFREVAPIYDDEYFPRDPRNRRVLHCTFLFGSLNQTEPKLRVPLSQFEFFSRKMTAGNLLRRLSDTVTPLGVLAIEGYRGDDDWFSLAEFYSVVQIMGTSQVHLFSVNDELADHPIIAELLRDGKLVAHPEGLSWALERGISQGFVALEAITDWEETNKRVSLRHSLIPIPRDLWNRVNKSATLLDDNILAPPSPISNDALYWEFRRFLFECGTRPLWSGFARGFAFPREFERKVHEKAIKQLDREASTDRPIIVHGQTGTGKTVALGNLAYKVAKSGEYPVIFIERKTQRPIDSDIDECCRWLENHGADATLIVWDGMVQPSEYYELQGYLASRGRKAVVVGSSYNQRISDDNLVEVPECLSVSEAVEFADFLESMGIGLSSRHRSDLENRDPSYLVALYRHLAPARPQIATGVVLELEQLEQELLNAVNRSSSSEAPLNSLAAAFLSGGLIDQSRIEEGRRLLGSQISAERVAELVDIVTVPGRFGINIPIELLARTWNQSDFTDLSQTLSSFDLLHSFEDSAGRVVVGPRHPLEARLIVHARVGSAQQEVSIISGIIKAIRSRSWGADESDETDFVIELLRAIGPNGDEQLRFAPFLREMAEAISEVRESRNIRSPRLMLQEANFLREWVTNLSRQGSRPEEAGIVLGKAQQILLEALEMLEDNQRQWRLRTFIATELASTYGSATIDSISTQGTNESVRHSFKQVLDAVHRARSMDFSSYNPVDVLVWSTLALAQPGIVDESTRTEAIVDVLDALETVDPDLLDERNRRRLHERRMDVSNLLGDKELNESAFQSLGAIGSAAGYYIRAREIAEPAGSLQNKSKPDARLYRNAWEYLETHRSEIGNDPRCLNSLFNYWWYAQTGHRLFEDERAALPFKESDWAYALKLSEDIRALGSHRDLALSFLEAIALFHLNSVSRSIQIFREVEGESYKVPSRRRILRSFLASEPGGNPRVFHGNVQSVGSGGRRSQVFVDELRHSITFLPADFGRPDIRQGDSLGEFHIAFNFIGPLADPRTRYSSDSKAR